MKIFALIIIITKSSIAAFEISNNNAFLSGLSNSVVASKNYPTAYLINPANSALIKNSFLGISYFRPYTLSDLNHSEITSCTNILGMGAGLGITSFGSKAYRENNVYLNLSHTFFDKRLSAGFNIHWYQISVENYQNSNSFGLDLGIYYEINPNVSAGFCIKNINQPQINDYTEEIPILTTWGVAVKLNEKLISHLAIQKESWFAPTFLVGISYSINNYLTIQSGFTTYPAQPSIGCQLKKSIVSFYYSCRFHSQLGSTHYWGISFQ